MALQKPPAVILVRPTESGNIGSVARAMANTGLDELIIIEPAAEIGRTARAFAVGAGSILDQCKRVSSFDDAVAPFQQLIGTSSQRSRDPRVPVLTSRQLGDSFGRKVQPLTALVFGPERSGLTTDELARCTHLVTIPASAKQPTLNLAQAVLIVAHEIFVADGQAADGEASQERANIGATEGLMSHLKGVLTEIGFARDDTFDSVFRDLRRLASRARLRPREVSILRGILRRAQYRLTHPASDSAAERSAEESEVE